MITIKNETQIEKMRRAGALLHSVLEALRGEIEPGVTTLHLDEMAERLIREGGGIPSSKGYEGFPYSICASVDDQVVHGFPDKTRLRKGQLLSVDCTCILDGWQSDSAFSVVVGGGEPAKQKLVEDTEHCFWLGAQQAVAGHRLGDIGHAVLAAVFRAEDLEELILAHILHVNRLRRTGTGAEDEVHEVVVGVQREALEEPCLAVDALGVADAVTRP